MRVGDSPTRVYRVKIKIQEQQRGEKLHRQSRHPRAKTGHPPYRKRKKENLAQLARIKAKNLTSPPSHVCKVGLQMRSCRVESPRVGV